MKRLAPLKSKRVFRKPIKLLFQTCQVCLDGRHTVCPTIAPEDHDTPQGIVRTMWVCRCLCHEPELRPLHGLRVARLAHFA